MSRSPNPPDGVTRLPFVGSRVSLTGQRGVGAPTAPACRPVVRSTNNGRIYSNQGAMTPGPSQETADGMSEALIDEVIGQMRRERFRFAPARRVWIPKKNGKLRPLGLPSWSDKLVGEVVRLPT